MKSVVLLALVALVSAAPKPKKLFHEHVEDFLVLIRFEAGHDLDHVLEHYWNFKQFNDTLDYLVTADFRKLIIEMESLPEFKAVIDYLEKDNIDIHYYLDLISEVFEEAESGRRHTISGNNFHSYIQDIIAQFPKEKLKALYNKKIAEDPAFKTAIENLRSDEFKRLLGALLNNEAFQYEVKVLAAHGIIVSDLIYELKALFGQN